MSNRKQKKENRKRGLKAGRKSLVNDGSQKSEGVLLKGNGMIKYATL